MACVPTVPTTIVSPSGAAFATESAPVLPPAPGLLSISIGWFQAGPSFSPMSRARMSGAPPGVKVTTMCIGLPAFVPWACAAGAAASPATTASEQARRANSAFIAAAFGQTCGGGGAIIRRRVPSAAAGSRERASSPSTGERTCPPCPLPFAPLVAAALLVAVGGCALFKDNEEVQATVNRRTVGKPVGEFFDRYGRATTRTEIGNSTSIYNWISDRGMTRPGPEGQDERVRKLRLTVDKAGKISDVQILYDAQGMKSVRAAARSSPRRRRLQGRGRASRARTGDEVAIVGAGIGGLTLALALHRAASPAGSTKRPPRSGRSASASTSCRTRAPRSNRSASSPTSSASPW